MILIGRDSKWSQQQQQPQQPQLPPSPFQKTATAAKAATTTSANTTVAATAAKPNREGEGPSSESWRGEKNAGGEQSNDAGMEGNYEKSRK